MTHPIRDPRNRHRRGIDAGVVAARLELAADTMRADQLAHGPAERWPGAPVEAVPVLDALRDQYLEPITAQEFADALAVDDGDTQLEASHSAQPASTAVATVTPPEPSTPAPPIMPAAFSNERGPRLTWASRHDPASRGYGIRDRLTASAPLTDRVWPIGPVLDQGAEGECVGCAVVDAANSLEQIRDPRPGGLDLTAAAAIYRRAQRLDDIPGEAYTGTSVLAGLKAGVEAGYFGGYLWAFGTRDVAQAVLQRGPVIVGVPWLSGMYDTGPGGLVKLEGDDQGLGHCLLVYGLRMRGPQGQPGPFFCWQNSWGESYGDHGTGWIHHRDLAALLHGAGEAAIVTRDAQAGR